MDTRRPTSPGAEEILGRLLAGRREKVVLATKVGNRMGDGPDDAGLSRGAILKQIDASLRRLNMDYVDLYYQHLPDRGTPLDETVAAMDEVVRQGKARAVGRRTTLRGRPAACAGWPKPADSRRWR